MEFTPAMDTTTVQIGRFVKETRKSLGATQRQLALTAGTGLRFVIDLEQGKPTCQLGKVLALLNTLGVELRLEAPAAGEA